jgi:DNA-binding IclR family transcriptional regulator
MRKRSPNTDESDSNGGDRQFITSLYRGLEVLRAFRPEDRAGLSNSDLAERTGLPNSTVSRLTYTLLKTGYLSYDTHTGRYRMGVPVLSLGYACLSGLPVREAAQGYMQELADYCGEGVMIALGGRDERTMTYLATARSKGLLALQLGVGSRISLARSAMGRAYLAACDDEERDMLLSDLAAHADPARWSDIRAGIDEARAQIENRGFYCNFGGWHSDVNSAAVPFRPQNPGEPLLVFNLGGPASSLKKARVETELGPKLLDLVRSFSLGIRGAH